MNDLQYSTLCYIVIFITITAFALYFRSVWVRGGYEGKNRILELFEVNRVYIHVTGFIFILTLEVMIFGGKDYPWPAWSCVISVITAAIGSELYVDFKKSIKNINHGKEIKAEERETEEAKGH